MPLIQVVLVLILIGVLLWLATTYIPMDPTIVRIIQGVVIIATVLWLISLFFGPIWNLGPTVGRGALR